MKTYALRLRPGEDLKAQLDAFAQTQKIEAACVLTCVGSLTRAVIRLANQEEARADISTISTFSQALNRLKKQLSLVIKPAC